MPGVAASAFPQDGIVRGMCVRSRGDITVSDAGEPTARSLQPKPRRAGGEANKDNTVSDTTDLDGLEAVFDHAAVAAPRLRDLLAVYRDLLGGVFLHGGDNTRVGFRIIQLGYSDNSKIELLEPLGDSTFFESFFRRTGGGGLHHITFKVRDLDLAVQRMTERGYRLYGLYRDDPAWQEVFLHPKESHGTLVQLAQVGAPAPTPDDPAPRTPEDVLAGRGWNGTGVPSP